MKYYIGCSGWWYKDWDGRFYPEGLDERGRLRYYCKYFNTTEVNVTFYRLPPITTFESWARRTPKNFVFSIKAPKEITHEMRLLYAERKMEKFYDLLSPLRKTGKLGVILFQLPPEFTKTQARVSRLRDFLGKLPSGYEYAMEFRHRSWITEETFRILEDHNVAYTIVDEPLLPPVINITSDITYIRFHGHGRKVWYYYNYRRDELERWAKKIRMDIEPKVRKLYIYFNNHFRGFAPKNASEFIEILGLRRSELGLKPLQKSLEDLL